VSLLTLSVVASVVSAYTPAFEYKHYPAGCVDGNNMKLVPGKTILECTELCDAERKCLAFEYGVAYGGPGRYKPGDCQMQTSADRRNCDGRTHNLDLHVKGKEFISTTTITETSTTTSATAHPKVDAMARKIEELEAAIANGNAAEEFAAVKETLDAADAKIVEQGKTIDELTRKLAAEKIEREALSKSVSGFPEQLAALQAQLDAQATDSAIGDDLILEKLDAVGTMATKDGGVSVDSKVESLCAGGDGCDAPQLSANGNDLLLEAPSGNIGIFSKSCTAGIDVCELAALAVQLKAALANMTFGGNRH